MLATVDVAAAVRWRRQRPVLPGIPRRTECRR
jgi:hypothetical protein